MRWLAELCTNGNGSLLRYAKLIDAAAEAGFQGVKTQQFDINRLYRSEALKAKPELLLRQKYEMPIEWHEELSARAREKGLLYGVTPFYLTCVEWLANHVSFFKLSSYQILDRDMANLMAVEELPIIVSTGMANMKEVQDMVGWLRGNGQADITLMHCVSAYPAPGEELNLSAIETLRREFNLPVGWSDHSTLPTAIRSAIWRWDAECVELHWDLDDRQGAETAHSWTPSSFKQIKGWMHDFPSSELKQYDGNGYKMPARCELEERKWRSDPEDGLRPIKGTL